MKEPRGRESESRMLGRDHPVQELVTRWILSCQVSTCSSVPREGLSASLHPLPSCGDAGLLRVKELSFSQQRGHLCLQLVEG